MAGEVFASGVVTAPGAGAAIATMASGSLPLGKYKVTVAASVSGAAVADLNNLRLRRGGVDLVANLQHGASGVPFTTELDEVELTGAQALTVEAIGVGTAAIEYSATIEALRLS